MMYFDYPYISATDRLAHAPPLDALRVRLTAEEALARLRDNRSPSQVVLSSYDGRPVYRFRFNGDELLLYADNGETQRDFSPELTLRAAAAWTKQPPSSAIVEENREEDQWTVAQMFRSLRPIRKYTWPDGEEVYVSTVTGEVVQYTTRASRLAAYFGPIPHWLYFTPLRKHESKWSRLVIWAAGLGTIVAILGLFIALATYSPSKRFQYAGAPSSIPYAGAKRWHMLLGLVFGPFACTWVFSGMLSMDPFPHFQSTGSDIAAVKFAPALSGTRPPLSAFAAKSPQQALVQLGPDFQAKRLEFTSFLGEPAYIASMTPDRTLIIPVHGTPTPDFNHQKIIEAFRIAAEPMKLTRVQLLTEYDAYYLDRHHSLPLPVIFLQLDDKEHSMYYVDPKTARIVQSYDSHSRWNRWLYHGLHSMDLPALYNHRPLWDVIVVSLLLGGASLSFTSLILAWRVLRQT